MRFRLLISAVIAASALLAVPAADAAAAPVASVKVRSCEVGNTARERQATFYARMRAVPGTARMQMRFLLLDRAGVGTTTIKSPQLSQWRRSRPGVRSFGYAQRVTGLETGGVYAAAVEFRWIGAGGKAIKSARRVSGACRQEGDLPNLAVTRLTADPGAAPGTANYSVTVTNRGSAAARAIVVDLFVDGAAADAREIDVLRPGETATVEVSGPSCGRRVRAVADRGDSIHETTEDDNALVARCPELRR